MKGKSERGLPFDREKSLKDDALQRQLHKCLGGSGECPKEEEMISPIQLTG